MGLRWAAADSHGSWISGYSVRDSTSGGQWSAWRSVDGGGSARDTTMTGLTDGRRYWFGVRAKNPVGSGPADTVSALAQTPTLTGPDSISYAENATDTVATYRLTPGGGSFSWSLAGADSSAFTGGDTLRFVRSPDYERPADGDRNNLYALNVRAVPSAKGFSPLSKSVKVKVRDVDETGTITLSRATPRGRAADHGDAERPGLGGIRRLVALVHLRARGRRHRVRRGGGGRGPGRGLGVGRVHVHLHPTRRRITCSGCGWRRRSPIGTGTAARSCRCRRRRWVRRTGGAR